MHSLDNWTILFFLLLMVLRTFDTWHVQDLPIGRVLGIIWQMATSVIISIYFNEQHSILEDFYWSAYHVAIQLLVLVSILKFRNNKYLLA